MNADEWRDSVEKRLAEGGEKMKALDDDIKANTAITKQIKDDTSEIITAFASVKGAFRVLEMIASVAKPLSYIAMLGTALAGFWYAIKGGK